MGTHASQMMMQLLYIMKRGERAIYQINTLENTKVFVKIYKHQQREAAHAMLWKEYFTENPDYPESDFRRRFLMHRPLFNRILEAVTNYNHYFIQKPDGLGRLGLTPHQTIITRLCHMCFGACADIWGEYLTICELTSITTLK